MYEERVINGLLCWRSHPEAEWIPFTTGQLSMMVMALQAQIKQLEESK